MEPRTWLIQYRGDSTQEEVAKLARISRSAYSNIEIGIRNPSVPMAKKIAIALKFDWRIFFDYVSFDTKQKEKKKSA